MVFGRSTERKRILDSVESRDIRTVVVYGPKYVGKSLLLHNIVSQWNEESRYRPVYLDLDSLGTSSSAEILEHLAALAESSLEISAEKDFSARGSNSGYWEELSNKLPADQKLLIVLDSLQPQPPLKAEALANLLEASESSESSSTANSTSNNSASVNATHAPANPAGSAPAVELISTIQTASQSSTEEHGRANGSLHAETVDDQTSEPEDEGTADEGKAVEDSDDDIVAQHRHLGLIISESHQELLAFLPQLLQHDQIKLIIGADCIEPGLVTEHFTDYLHQTRTIQLNPFGKEETEKVLLSEGMEGIVDWNNRSAYDRVWELTSGHPAFVTAISSSISDSVFQDIGDLRRAKVVTANLINTTLPNALDKVEPTVNWYWNNLSQAEQMVLSIISYVEPEGISVDAIALVLSDIELTYLGWNRSENESLFETRPTQINLNEVLRKLRQLNLIEQSGHEYRLKIRLMLDWVLDNHPLPEEFIGIIYNATKKPIAKSNQSFLNGPSAYGTDRTQRWRRAGLIAATLAVIAVVAFLAIQWFAPDRGFDTMAGLFPRAAESIQSPIGIDTQSADSSDGENAITDATSNETIVADAEAVATSDITSAESESPTATSSENANAPVVSTPTLPENSVTPIDSQTGSSAEANPENNSSSAESTGDTSASEVAANEDAADQVALASDGNSAESQAASENDADELDETAVASPAQEENQPETGSLDPESPDISTSDNRVLDIDLAKNFTLLQEVDVDDLIWSVSISSDEQKLAVGLDNGSIVVIPLSEGEDFLAPEAFQMNEQEILAVAFSPQQPALLAAASADSTVQLWDVETGEMLHNLNEHTDEVSALAFHPDGSILVSGSADGTVRLWDVETGDATGVLGGENGWVLTAAFSPDGTELATGTIDGTIQIWDVARLTKLDTLQAHEDWTSSVAYSPSADLLASASYDGSVLLWKLDEQSSTSPTENQEYLPTGVVNSVAFDASGRYLFGGQHNGSLLVWDLINPEMHSVLLGHDDAIRSIDISPMGNYVATGALDGMVHIYKVDAE